MKHTLKSLLITTVLTLPTAFGAESLPAQEPSSSASVPEESYYDRAAELYKKAATREDAAHDDILRAANGLIDLTSVYPENSDERIEYNRMVEEILQKRRLSN